MSRELLRQALDALDYCPDDNAVVLNVFEAISAELAKPEPVPLSDDAIEQAYNEAWLSLPSDFGHTSGDWFAAGARYTAAEVARAVAEERERLAADAVNFGVALNDAGWENIAAYSRHMGEDVPGRYFNAAKSILRDSILAYFKALGTDPQRLQGTGE